LHFRSTTSVLFVLAFLAPHAFAGQSAPQQPARVRVDWQVQRELQVSGKAAVYPPLAVMAQIEGSVRLAFVVSADGSTRDVTVLSGHPLFQTAAIDSVRTWRFKPTLVGDAPVEVETITAVNFFLPGHDANTILAPDRKAVEKHPDDAKAHERLGRRLLSVGEVDQALVEFRKAISLQPDRASTHFGLGDAIGATGDVDGAISEYRRGLSIDSTDANAHDNLARLLDTKGDLDGAIAEYRGGLQLKPGEGFRHFNVGLQLEKKSDLDAAIAEFRLALKGVTIFAAAHYHLGLALEQKGDLEAALKEYKKALSDEPENQSYQEARDRLAEKLHK
jgi:TonB family protein